MRTSQFQFLRWFAACRLFGIIWRSGNLGSSLELSAASEDWKSIDGNHLLAGHRMIAIDLV
jgi:hypothetical protein